MTRLSDSIFCQNAALQGDEVRSLIITSPPEPERSHEKREASGDQTRIIHRHGANGYWEREAENNDKGDDVKTGNSVDEKSRYTFHPEPARSDIRSLAKKMRQDGGEVGERGQHDEGPDKGVKCGLASYVNAAEEWGYGCTQDDRVEWIPLLLVYSCKKVTEWRGLVASESPEYTAGGQEEPHSCKDRRYKYEEEKTQSAPYGAGSLAVDFGKGEEVRAGQDGLEIVNAIEEGNDVEESREKSDNVLC